MNYDTWKITPPDEPADYCFRHQVMHDRVDGCAKCDMERDRADWEAAMDDAAEREAGRVSELMAMEPNHLKLIRGGR